MTNVQDETTFETRGTKCSCGCGCKLLSYSPTSGYCSDCIVGACGDSAPTPCDYCGKVLMACQLESSQAKRGKYAYYSYCPACIKLEKEELEKERQDGRW